jgi:hypothetical protein
MVEALKVRATAAVFVVHVFLSDAVDDEKVRSNDGDYSLFIKHLGGLDAANVDDGTLIGPLTVPGGPFVPSDTPLYVGKIKT